jgi:hypothetical protein
VTNFKRLLEVLVHGRVDFVIVGGLAATIHGSARLTQDVDVVYDRSDANVNRLVDALRPLRPYLRGAPPGLPFEWSPETVRRGLNFTLTTEAGDLDLLGEIVGGGAYPRLFEHSIVIHLFGHDCRCVTLPELIRSKRAAGRPKDLEAVAELEVILEEHEGSG